jgi:hypothetical protein
MYYLYLFIYLFMYLLFIYLGSLVRASRQPILPVLYPKPATIISPKANLLSANMHNNSNIVNTANNNNNNSVVSNLILNSNSSPIPSSKIGKVPKENISNEHNDASSVHVGVSCDGCGKSPLSGIRFKCVNCDEFNFCEDCEVRDTFFKVLCIYFIYLFIYMLFVYLFIY